MICTTEALTNAVRRAQEAGSVGVDTEFIWSRTYYPTLCIVQLGYPDGHCELIDALKIKDWSPLAELMSDSETLKILHDAQQDLNILYRVCGGRPKNIFDTQQSSGFIGLSSTISLAELQKTLLRIRLAKTETRSDWSIRPLSEAQIKYAEDDVSNSVRLMVRILDKAEKLGRKEWIETEMKMYENADHYAEAEPPSPPVRGSGGLTHQQRNILEALASWRELTARKRNLPRGFILPDEAIVSLAKRPPERAGDIRQMKGLSEKSANRNRKYIWQAIENGRNGDLPELPNKHYLSSSPDPGYKSRTDLSLAIIKGICLANEMDPALIANRAEVTAFVLEINNPDLSRHRMLCGWRADFCGNRLAEFLRGKGSVSIDPETKLPCLR